MLCCQCALMQRNVHTARYLGAGEPLSTRLSSGPRSGPRLEQIALALFVQSELMTTAVKVKTLGRCAVLVGSRAIDPSAPIVFAGLLLLALERGRWWTRIELIETLWH